MQAYCYIEASVAEVGKLNQEFTILFQYWMVREYLIESDIYFD